MELVAGNAALKHLARWALLEQAGAAHLAAEIRKRLATLKRSRSFVAWNKQKTLVADLERQRTLIMEKIAPEDPVLALDLMWRFLELAAPTYERSDDSNGRIGDVFRTALQDLGTLLPVAKPEAEALAEQVYAKAVEGNNYGEYDGLIGRAASTLGVSGLARLKAEVEGGLKSSGCPPAEDDGAVIGWGITGALHRDRFEYDHRQRTLNSALLEIADAQGDADAFIATLDPDERTSIWGAVAIAQRLLRAGRADEALDYLDGAADGPSHLLPRLTETRIAVLEALGQADDAQTLRWQAFEETLDRGHLKAFLEGLPDFDDMEAEERALDHVVSAGNPHDALVFLINWPALERAGTLVRADPETWDGDFYEILRPAAEALESNDPLAATILRRAMIRFTLEAARSKRYKHAARHLMECEGLDAAIEDYGDLATHAEFLAELRSNHARKSGFWTLVK